MCFTSLQFLNVSNLKLRMLSKYKAHFSFKFSNKDSIYNLENFLKILLALCKHNIQLSGGIPF